MGYALINRPATYQANWAKNRVFLRQLFHDPFCIRLAVHHLLNPDFPIFNPNTPCSNT